MPKPPASVAVVGAGDHIGSAIARRFAQQGFHVFAGRRNGDKLAPLVAEIAAAGGTCTGLSLDARRRTPWPISCVRPTRPRLWRS